MRWHVAIGGALALQLCACAAALKEPPPISTLQREPAGTAPAAALVDEAAEAFAKRPDLTAVRRAEALCLALQLCACAAALKEPPPISTLQREPAGTAPAAALVDEAAEAFAKRPDLTAVRRAEALCLAAAQADESSTDGLICAARAKSWLAEREMDVAVRTDLAVSAVQVGQWCLRRAPDSAPCKFWLAVALGMQARDRRTTVEDGLKRMAQLLREVAKSDPLYDQAGAERVLGLLQVRAPGWPVGPGDSEEALVHVRKAVELRPDYPPNQIALGEVLLRVDEKAAGAAALRKGIELAGKAPWASDPDAPSWIAEARSILPR